MLQPQYAGCQRAKGDSSVANAMEQQDFAEPDNPLIYRLMEMFPQVCPRYVRKICQGKPNWPGVLDDLISQILEADYPRRQKLASPEHPVDAEQQLEIIKQILPDADPDYLQMHCDRLINKPDELKVFVAEALETRNYPTMKEFLRKQQLSAQQKQYTTEFNVENFLEIIPDAIAYFNDPKRKPSIVSPESAHYALCFLRNHFPQVLLRVIRDTFRRNHTNLLATCKQLEKAKPNQLLKSKRNQCRLPESIENIPLLQEIAFIQHRRDIELFLEAQKEKNKVEREQARKAGLLQTCCCCFDEEVMPKEMFSCENGCIFCKECVRKGAEVAFGDGKLDFACLNNCTSHFSLQTLQVILSPKMFSKVAQKKQLEEVKAAGMEDLEMCPFCDFATIPAKNDKIFRCLNPDCMKESCRLCKESSHIPLRCDEVEKEDDVKVRTYIENKMTEALLRKCYKCGIKFIKADGCNKMMCSCGALMCYVCRQPVKDYTHFNGPGGDRTDLCPLFSDTNQLHENAVLKGAEEAKLEIGVDVNPSKLKHDPTADLQKYYEEVRKKNPAPFVAAPAVNPFGYIDVQMQEAQRQILQRLEELQRLRHMHHVHHRHHHQQHRRHHHN